MHRRTFVQALGASLASAVPDFRGKYSAFGQSSWNGTSGPLTSLPVSPTGRFTPDTARSLDDWREWADRFNAAGATARRAGIWLAFHNEPDHMTPIDGTVPYDVFVARTDPAVVRLQLDVGNLVMGGGDPLVYLQRYRDRYWSFHLKDVVPDRSRDTELGTGTLDFRRLLAAVPDIDRKPCYVEQEGAADSLASARRNCEFLSKLEF